ncbi:hypothetical protein QZH41_010452, partial [Actinostola sp. cb2023]
SLSDLFLFVSRSPESGDLRFGSELCDEELEFLAKRKQVVFEAMKDLLGDRAPTNINEVPTIALLGSGGGFRAMTSLSGVLCALKDTNILDCVTYFAGLSGSAWYISSLYSHPEWPSVHPRVVLEELRENLKENMMWQLVKPKWVYKHMQLINKKKKNGQPVSFTDVFGYLVGETIAKGREPPKLSSQKVKLVDAVVPLPLYTCVNVKKDVSAHAFCGIWGSAFTILLQQVARDGLQEPVEVVNVVENKGEVRKQMEDMVASDEIDKYNKTSDDSDEDSNCDQKNVQNGEEKEDAAPNNDEEGKTDADKFVDIADKVINKFEVFRTRQGRAGLVHNFLRGLDISAADQVDNVDYRELVTETKRIFLVDSGLVLNSPYPILLRPQRGVDLYLSFDFSARDKDDEQPFKELLLAEEWARKNNYPFPPINASEQLEQSGLKECYVFRHPTDPTCPVIVHFVLINKMFMEYTKP